MSYIYDILLNFNSKLYDFYDWNKTDHIIHIKKIPLFKINHKKLIEIINNKIIFDSEILEKIKDKTEEYLNHKIRVINYAFLLTDGLQVIGINLIKGVKYSTLLLDEENDVLEVASRLKESSIKYQIVSKSENNFYQTRKEQELEEKALKELDNIIKENNKTELKYLYYDCFNEKCDNIEYIKKVLSNKIMSGEITNKVNEFINLKKCIKH